MHVFQCVRGFAGGGGGGGGGELSLGGGNPSVPPLLYQTLQSVDEHWQRLACSILSIPFACSNNVRQGGAAVVLKRPQNTQNIRGDGNCLFRAFSYLITGNQTHYHGVRLAIVTHMRSIQTFIISNGYTSVEQYVSETGMNRTSVWGTRVSYRIFGLGGGNLLVHQ